MKIYSKLYGLKKEVGAISKSEKNPFYNSKYFDINKLLEEVEPLMDKHGLLLLQPIKDNKVITKIIDIETGEKVDSSIELNGFTDPQKLGSAITYYRRYTLQSLLGLQAEDDDANKTVQKPTDRKPALTIEQFEATKKGTKAQINAVLNGFRMSAEQRKVLEIKVK